MLTHPDRLDWLKPAGAAKTWLCSIAGDLFHPDVPDQFIHDALARTVSVQIQRIEKGLKPHRVAILTKRFDHAVEIFHQAFGWPRGLILMPSAGTQDSVDRACAAMARFPEGVMWGLHLEPIWESLDLSGAIGMVWCVVGGETHIRNRRQARPCHPDWIREIKYQCLAAGVPFWLKALGHHWALENGLAGKGGLVAEWPEDLRENARQMPEGWENHER